MFHVFLVVVILRAQRDQVLTRLEKINKERIAVLAKVNEIRSGILERRDQHRREVESIQEQINSEVRNFTVVNAVQYYFRMSTHLLFVCHLCPMCLAT